VTITDNRPDVLRGAALAYATLDHIEAHPRSWHQGEWRCRSGMCFAGHAAVLAGGRWADVLGTVHDTMMLAEDGDLAGVRRVDGTPVVAVGRRAARLLGIDGETAGDIFHADNTFDDLREKVERYLGPRP